MSPSWLLTSSADVLWGLLHMGHRLGTDCTLALTLSLFLCLPVCLCLPHCLDLSLCISVSLSMFISVSLYLCLSVSVSLCLSLSLSRACVLYTPLSICLYLLSLHIRHQAHSAQWWFPPTIMPVPHSGAVASVMIEERQQHVTQPYNGIHVFPASKSANVHCPLVVKKYSSISKGHWLWGKWCILWLMWGVSELHLPIDTLNLMAGYETICYFLYYSLVTWYTPIVCIGIYYGPLEPG